MAILIGKWFVVMVFFEFLIGRNNLLDRSNLHKVLLVLIPLSILVYFINKSIFVFYYLPFILLSGIALLWYLQHKLEINIYQKFMKRFRNDKK